MNPLAIELFAGLHGWGEGLVSEGFRVVGFDIVDMCRELGQRRPDGCDLVLQDVLTLHGSQFRDAAVIVASPPCQAYSYRTMPWKRAKALPPPSNELFDACFRIQREACAAAGRYIPMVVENVKGAQPWVGRAAWHYDSFYLWGDVPALMPFSGKSRKSQHVPLVDTPAGTGKTSWFFGNSKHEGRFYGQDGLKTVGHVNIRDGHTHTRHLTNQRESDAVKQGGLSGPLWFDQGAAAHSSKSNSRKAASAQIAKIPFVLSSHIARVYHPGVSEPPVGDGPTVPICQNSDEIAP